MFPYQESHSGSTVTRDATGIPYDRVWLSGAWVQEPQAISASFASLLQLPEKMPGM